MRKFLSLLVFLSLFVTNVEAGTVSRPSKSWGTTSFVNGVIPTADDWNGDPDTLYAEFNGNIANANISSTAAIGLSKINFSTGTATFGSPPALGVTGIVFGSGSSVIQGVAVTGIIIGQNNSVPITFSSQTCSGTFIKAINANGVVTCGGATLDMASGGTGSTTFAANSIPISNGTVLNALAVGTANQVLRIPGAGGAPTYGQVDLTQSAAVSGALAAANGGTGANTSASTGVPSISAGTWTVATTLATTLGGTGVATSARFKLLNSTRDLTAASGTIAVAHGVTGTPKTVVVFATKEGSGDMSNGVSDGSAHYSIRQTASWGYMKTTAAAWLGDDTNYQSATITFDATNVNLVWTKTGTPSGTGSIVLLVFF